MTLYFTNNSKQKRILIKTNYIEDIYDTMLSFFEDYHIRPRFLQLDENELGEWKISFGSITEFFYVTDTMGQSIDGLRDLMEES